MLCQSLTKTLGTGWLNMSDYISRDAITEWRPKNIEIINSRAYIDLEELLALIDGIPAADVEPVQRRIPLPEPPEGGEQQ